MHEIYEGYLDGSGLSPAREGFDKSDPLHWAANRNNIEDLQALLRSRRSIDAPDAMGRTPLHAAACRSDAAARKLIDRGADPNLTDKWHRTPLFLAALYGDESTVRALLAAHADPQATDVDGRTPLHAAALANKQEIIASLLAAGAQVDCTDATGRTPLHVAALRGGRNCARLLLVNKAAPNAVDAEGRTPLDDAQKEYHSKVADLIEKWGGTHGPGPTIPVWNNQNDTSNDKPGNKSTQDGVEETGGSGGRKTPENSTGGTHGSGPDGPPPKPPRWSWWNMLAGKYQVTAAILLLVAGGGAAWFIQEKFPGSAVPAAPSAAPSGASGPASPADPASSAAPPLNSAEPHETQHAAAPEPGFAANRIEEALPSAPAAPERAPAVQEPAPQQAGDGPASREHDVSGDEIREIQKLLNQTGYDCGEPDGKPGGQTRTAIMKFQKSNGLPADGKPRRSLLVQLRMEIAKQ